MKVIGRAYEKFRNKEGVGMALVLRRGIEKGVD